MKVCHLTSVHGQEDTRIFHKECVSLAKAGYEVYEISRGNTYDKNGVHIIGINDLATGRITRMSRLVRKVYLKALEIDANIYHAHDPELLPILLKLKGKGKTVIFDSHENVAGTIKEKHYIPKPLRLIVKFAYETFQTYACKRIDAVITATPNITDYFKGIGCQRVIDLCNFPLLNNNFVEPDYRSRTLSFAGGTTGQWNHDIIISAIDKMDNVKYSLCGNNNSYIERLKQLPGWKKVDFKGRIPFEQVADLLQHSAIGLSLLTPGNNTDGKNGNMANTKIFEQMTAGLPIVCTNFVRWKEFVDGYDCGICVDPRSVEEVSKAINRLLDNPEVARKKGLNGRRAIEERFNWNNEEKKLLTLYKKLEGEIHNG